MKAMFSNSNRKHLYRFIFILVCNCLLALAYTAVWDFAHGNSVYGSVNALSIIIIITVVSIIIFCTEKPRVHPEEKI